jgi:3-oxoadipate enol-lactonase
MVAVSYVEQGAGLPLLMGSSLGTDSRLWAPIADALADQHRVIRYDHRGHGSSPVPDGDYSLEQVAGDALELMDSLGLDRVDYCGVSLGGMVGMWLAAHHPTRIRRLVLVSTSAHLAPQQPWIDRAALVRAEGMPAVAQPTLERWLTPEFLDADSAEVGAIREQLLGTDPQGYAGCAMAVGEMDLRDALASIDAPTLVIVADDDPSTPPSHGELIAGSISGAEVVRVAGRHLALVEDPDRFASLIRAFLDR